MTLKWVTPNPPCPLRPKNKIFTKENRFFFFLPQELLDDFLWGFGVWSHNWKRKKKGKVKEETNEKIHGRLKNKNEKMEK